MPFSLMESGHVGSCCYVVCSSTHGVDMPLSKGPAAKFVRPISFVFVFVYKFKFLLYLYAAANSTHGANIPLSKGPPAMFIIPH